jgi:hypothetical protein
MKKIANILVPAMLLGTPAVASNFSRSNSRQKNKKTVSVSEIVDRDVLEFLKNNDLLENETNPFDGFEKNRETQASQNLNNNKIDALTFLKEEGLLQSTEKRENSISGEDEQFIANQRKDFAGTTINCVSGATWNGNNITQFKSVNYCSVLNDNIAFSVTYARAMCNLMKTACETVPIDSDANLTISSTVDESSMILIPSTADTFAEKVDIFDFTILDGGSSDGVSTDITQIDLNTSGTADFSKVTWVLNGDDVSDKNGTFDSSSDILSFTDLNISVDDNSSETYKISGYFNNNSGLKDNTTFGLSLNGINIETNSSKTQFGSTPTITNNENAKVDITGTKLYFYILPNR